MNSLFERLTPENGYDWWRSNDLIFKIFDENSNVTGGKEL
tara:strand:+ start:315 stop:434 length:120 start_codon:yes stop_codon:yes gene_type:complete